MRLMKWALALGVSVSTGAMVAVGCGGDDSNSPSDAGGDATGDGFHKDTGGGGDSGGMESSLTDMGMMCMSDADLLTYMVPDGGEGVDAGINLETCVMCLQNKCMKEVEACQNDCTCLDGLVAALPCVQKMGLSAACITAMLQMDQSAIMLAGCALQQCGAGVCTAGPMMGDGGTDGGGGDAPADSPGDGG